MAKIGQKRPKNAYIFPYIDKNGQNWLKMAEKCLYFPIYRQKWPKLTKNDRKCLYSWLGQLWNHPTLPFVQK